ASNILLQILSPWKVCAECGGHFFGAFFPFVSLLCPFRRLFMQDFLLFCLRINLWNGGWFSLFIQCHTCSEGSCTYFSFACYQFFCDCFYEYFHLCIVCPRYTCFPTV